MLRGITVPYRPIVLEIERTAHLYVQIVVVGYFLPGLDAGKQRFVGNAVFFCFFSVFNCNRSLRAVV